MNSIAPPFLLALVIQLALGLVVVQANAKRRANQCFLILCCVVGAWLILVHLGLTSSNLVVTESCIREASATGAIFLLVLNFLRISIASPNKSWRTIFYDSRIWLLPLLAVVALCQTKFFLQGIQLRLLNDIGSVVPLYGEGAKLYALYFVFFGAFVLFEYARGVRRSQGAIRAELSVILIATAAVLATVVLSVMLGAFVDRSRLMWFAPFRFVLFSVIVAYGIATRRVMQVGVLLRRILSYSLLAAYLFALYTLVWWLVATALHSSPQSHSIAHVTAAIVIAIAMVPARGMSQRLAERLFIQSHQLDFRATVSKAAKILSSVKTLRDLLDTFAETVAEALGTDRVFILLSDKLGFSQRYPAVESGSYYRLELTRDQATIEQLESNREPIVLDELHRIRSTPQLQRAIRQLDSLQISLAVGIYARDQLAGVLLLGVRKSGRIYGTVEQNALQVLCGQLAVAIENAELFTEVQNAKIYNETLLQSLTSGVIAVGTDERITVFNNEAGEICALNSDEMIDCKIDDLPEALREPLRMAFQSGQSQVNHEMVLTSGDEGLVIRASASIFHGEDRKVLGALMVLTDITSLKRLELQIRRSDRLASLGTLSAGMAHEIKNPLVSIKTFAQLLPERYQDSDFRETFSNLIGHEIERIDTLVNQLLRFARPAKPILKPMHVHEIVQKALQLVDHRMYQKQIKLTRLFDANVDTIRADPDQLEQVFLNFFINAMDAMKNGGELTVRTEIGSDEQWAAALNHVNGGDTHEVLRITIRDTGEGIRSEDLAHVFDPFFTTKDHGTGLGLSVVHGIIQEHGGQIEVESEPQKGTAFHILLPLVRFDREVAAA